MRTTKWTSRFKKDVKREIRGLFRKTLEQDLTELTALLEVDASLPDRYRDHALTGNWRDYRDCHVHPDLVMIYRKPDAHSLELVRIGSHSELEL
jgi:mRNA interferase YafQ